MSTTPPEDASKAAPRTPARPKREETRGYANRERTPTVESLEELETLWNTMGIQSEDLIPDTGGTIAPEPNGPGPKRLPTLESLPPLVTKAGGSTTPELDVGKTLGQGGMGLVMLARQVPLDREVAVKSLNPRSQGVGAAQTLLREARTTGSLEHPNIIPIHALGRDHHGLPMFVMKRVDGVVWTELINDPAHEALAGQHHASPLEFHIEVLMQVCNAVHFAHSRGILHRDLKPDNVMIGPFGEVYVLDWGIAVSLKDDPDCNLRRVRDLKEVVGTPFYMAPEMARGDGAQLSESTDVFLLGAVLHECITGKRRHAGVRPMEVVVNAFNCAQVDYDETVPRELAAICNRATAQEPADRYESAESLRLALATFLRHRDSAALGQEAADRLKQLRSLLQREEHPAEVDHQAHALFTECRFGFQQALRTWPQNEEAGQGLRAALELMAAHQIRDGDRRAASALIAELEHPPEELIQQLRELDERLQEEQHRLDRLRRLETEMDLNVGRRTRSVMMLIAALLYSLLPFVMGMAERRGWVVFSLELMALNLGIFILLGIGFGRWARETLSKTRVNRQLVRALRLLFASLPVFLGGCALLGIDAHTALPLLYLLFAIFVGTLAATVDRSLLTAAATFGLSFLLASLFRSAIFEILGAGNLLGCLCVARAWWPDTWDQSKSE